MCSSDLSVYLAGNAGSDSLLVLSSALTGNVVSGGDDDDTIYIKTNTGDPNKLRSFNLDGGTGVDELLVELSDHNDVVTVSKTSGGNWSIAASISSITVAGVEGVTFELLDGADDLTFNALSGTGVDSITVKPGSDSNTDNLNLVGTGNADSYSMWTSWTLPELTDADGDEYIDAVTLTDNADGSGGVQYGDLNKDGKLSKEEFMAKQKDPEHAAQNFVKFDKDKSGDLSKEEFVKMGK